MPAGDPDVVLPTPPLCLLSSATWNPVSQLDQAAIWVSRPGLWPQDRYGECWTCCFLELAFGNRFWPPHPVQVRGGLSPALTPNPGYNLSGNNFQLSGAQPWLHIRITWVDLKNPNAQVALQTYCIGILGRGAQALLFFKLPTWFPWCPNAVQPMLDIAAH